VSDLCGQDGFAKHLRARYRIVPRHLNRNILLCRGMMRANGDPTATGAEDFANDVSASERPPKLAEQPRGFRAVGLLS
jgi:hypothetical protein